MTEQIRALTRYIIWQSHGLISRPAEMGSHSLLYFGHLAGTKENNGAAMSLGRTSTYGYIYTERS